MVEPNSNVRSSSPLGTLAAPQPGLAVLEIEGADAASFLQGQLSGNVLALVDGAAQYTSYNSPKGRMLANGLLWRDDAAHFGLVLAADLAAAVAKRLAMFVLRAKAAVHDRSQELAVIGIGGNRAGEVLAESLGVAVPAPLLTARREGRRVIALPDGRLLLVVPRGQADAALVPLRARAEVVTAEQFAYLAIAAGVPLITAATTDQFVPQTANWELLGGVAFDKGCYTGQEIIARMQYLGRLKERLYAFTSRDEVAPGTRLYSAAYGDQACGTVVNVAPAPSGGVALLAVLQLDAMPAGSIRVAAPDGPALAPMSLPYALPNVQNPPRERLR